MAGGRPGIEPGSLPYSNVLPCGRTASGGYPYYWGIHQSGMKSFSMHSLLYFNDYDVRRNTFDCFYLSVNHIVLVFFNGLICTGRNKG